MGQKTTTFYDTEKEEIHAPNGAFETKKNRGGLNVLRVLQLLIGQGPSAFEQSGTVAQAFGLIVYFLTSCNDNHNGSKADPILSPPIFWLKVVVEVSQSVFSILHQPKTDMLLIAWRNQPLQFRKQSSNFKDRY